LQRAVGDLRVGLVLLRGDLNQITATGRGSRLDGIGGGETGRRRQIGCWRALWRQRQRCVRAGIGGRWVTLGRLSRSPTLFVCFAGATKSAMFGAISAMQRCVMAPYLRLTDAEWKAIEPILPVPKRGPNRPHDRAVCAAFLFCRAAGVSMESLPLGQFPDPRFLRTTWARWQRDDTLQRLFKVGAPAQARMERQYDDHIRALTLDRVVVTGQATPTLPRWTHVRPRA
jgi:transposase